MVMLYQCLPVADFVHGVSAGRLVVAHMRDSAAAFSKCDRRKSLFGNCVELRSRAWAIGWAKVISCSGSEAANRLRRAWAPGRGAKLCHVQRSPQ